MAVGGISSHSQVYLDFLTKLGVPKAEVNRLHEAIFKADQLSVDVYGRVAAGKLKSTARDLKIALPEAELDRLLGPSRDPVEKLPKDASFLPTLTLEGGEVRRHPENLAPARLSGAAIGSLSLQSFLTACHKGKYLATPIDVMKEGIDAQQLLDLLQKHHHLARQHLTSADLEGLRTRAFSARGPSYTERDAVLRMDSKFQPLAPTGVDGVCIFKKSSYEDLFLRRGADGHSFTLGGFEAEKVAVTLPPGHSLVLVDGNGDQLGYRLPSKKMTLSGQDQLGDRAPGEKLKPGEREVQVVEISSSLISASGKEFTLRVLGPKQEPVHQRRFAFNDNIGRRSQTLFSGEFRYQDKPRISTGTLDDEHFAHFVPSPGKNSAPAGERPSFRFEGHADPFDQLLIKRDDRTFSVNRLVQLASPPAAKPQVLKAESGPFIILDYAGASTSKLDHPEYSPFDGFTVRDSNGHGATFHRALVNSNQAFWDHRGLRVTTHDGTKTYRVDPLAV
ncbi:MAG: hypothetical protein IT384_21110 [Deltaproteobacteria bacterium]|nr:hypothetical protein [Deltaproteobacteria bacterium]